MGDVVELRLDGGRRTAIVDVRRELLGIANRLDAVKEMTEFPRWLSALSGEVRKAARECKR